MSRIRSSRVLWVALAVTIVTAAPCAAGDICDVTYKLYFGTVFWHGPSSSIYVNTPLYGCISDAQGNCTPTGGYLYLENFSRDTRVYWSSLAGGEGVFRLLAPQQRTVKYLPIYRRPGDGPLEVDLDVKVCPAETPGQPGGTPGGTPGGNTGGNTGGNPGGNTGGNPAGNPGTGYPAASDTYFVDLTRTFSENGQWVYQGFTVRQNVTFDARFVADYAAVAALVPEAEIANFTAGRAFSGYAMFDRRIGTQSVTLGPGTYYAAVRNVTAGANTARFEVDYRLSVPGAVFAGWDIGDARVIQPRGGKAWQSFTVSAGVRYFLDGCNSGLETFIIPDSEIGNFTSGAGFRYYTDYSSLDDNSAPGQWEVRLPPGTYWLAFRNQDSTPHSVTYQLERWRQTSTNFSTVQPFQKQEAGHSAAQATGLQAAWVNASTHAIYLRFSERLDADAISPDRFRIAFGGTTLTPGRATYRPDLGILALDVPELDRQPGEPSVSWTGLRTDSGAVADGGTDPLKR